MGVKIKNQKKIPRASNKTSKTPKNPWTKTFKSPQKSHAEFPILKNFQMQFNAFNSILKQPQNKFGCTLFTELRGRDTRTLPRIFRLFGIRQNQANQKNLKSKKSFDHSRQLKSGVPPPPTSPGLD